MVAYTPRGRNVGHPGAAFAQRPFRALFVAAAAASPAGAATPFSLRSRAHGVHARQSFDSRGRLQRSGFATEAHLARMSREQVDHLPQCTTFVGHVDELNSLRETVVSALPPAGGPAFGYPGETDGKGWRRAEQEAGSGSQNLCVDGRLLPELYVLGAAKAATTSLAADLLGAGVEVAERDCRSKNDKCDGWVNTSRLTAHVKEFHFFDFAMDWLDGSVDAMEGQRRKWLSTLPQCDGTDTSGGRRLIGDFTPDNLRLLPLPVGVEPDGYFQGTFQSWLLKRGAAARAQATQREINLPLALRQVYYKEQSNRLNFVVMLREPAERMQSHWYCCICPDGDCRRSQYGSFSNDLREALVSAQSTPAVYNDWLWYSLYGHHLEEWLTHFDSEQFTFVPYKEYVVGDKDRLCREIAQRLHFAMDCDSGSAEATWIGRKNAHKRPQDDLEPAVFQKFQEFIAPENQHLVQLLAWAHTQGATLLNYETVVVGDKLSVKDWLETNW